MRGGYGSVFLYSVIMIYIVVIFSFIIGTVSYNKSYKVNTLISHSLETWEGYNQGARDEIKKKLDTIGYIKGNNNVCKERDGAKLVSGYEREHEICIYYIDAGAHYHYGIETYMFVELPLIGTKLKIPVYSKSERIHHYIK